MSGQPANPVTMPKWPAWIMGGLMVVSAYPALTAATPAPVVETPFNETYEARGEGPGWLVRIGGGRIHYAGGYFDPDVDLARPNPVERSNGRRYATPQLAVDVAYERCNDALSGAGYEHRVIVNIGRQELRGCGGARRTDWDI